MIKRMFGMGNRIPSLSPRNDNVYLDIVFHLPRKTVTIRSIAILAHDKSNLGPTCKLLRCNSLSEIKSTNGWMDNRYGDDISLASLRPHYRRRLIVSEVVPCWQRGPYQPGRHRQQPVAGSHSTAFSPHSQRLEQFCP